MSKYLVGSALLILLSGCSLFTFERRAAWRDEAEQACNAASAVKVSAYVEPARTISGPGACGMLQPYRITALANGTVSLTSRAVLACPIIPQIDRWIEELLQPAALLYFGSRVVELRAGSYACRGINNRIGGPHSEHSFGNAVDVMSFRLADGREITVERGWRGLPEEQEFLREVFVGSCRYFATVLGPGSDSYHYNHFHLDLARHSGGRRICKPILKFTPRIDPAAPITPRITPMAQPGSLYPDFGEGGPAGRYGAEPGEEPSELQIDDPVEGALAPTVRPPSGLGWTRQQVR